MKLCLQRRYQTCINENNSTADDVPLYIIFFFFLNLSRFSGNFVCHSEVQYTTVIIHPEKASCDQMSFFFFFVLYSSENSRFSWAVCFPCTCVPTRSYSIWKSDYSKKWKRKVKKRFHSISYHLHLLTEGKISLQGETNSHWLQASSTSVCLNTKPTASGCLCTQLITIMSH